MANVIRKASADDLPRMQEIARRAKTSVIQANINHHQVNHIFETYSKGDYSIVLQ